MRFLAAGVLFGAFLGSGCAGGFPASRDRGELVPERSAFFGQEAAPLSVESYGPGRDDDVVLTMRPGPAADAARRLAAAGGGRPLTGYVGLGAALYFASDRDLSNGWGLDLNYTQNITEQSSVELSLGTVAYDLQAAGRDGGFSAVTIGAVAQYGRPFGTSRWYVGAGAAYWLNDTTGLGGLDADDSFALILEGGTEFPLSGRANLCLEFRYTFSKADLSGGGDLDLNAFAARANYVFVF